ncbi:MAG: hypothetical protein Hens3KO_02860 [Henriciella sp.]
MTEAIDNPSAGWRMKVAIFALAVSIFSVLWLMVAALGTKFGLWPYQVGLQQMTGRIGFPISALALLLALIAQIISLIKFPRKQAFMVALAATLIAAYCCGRLASGMLTAISLPPIHDVQTDWETPIQFSDTLMQRRADDGAENPVTDSPIIADWAKDNWPSLNGRLVSEVQEEAEMQSVSEDGNIREPVYPKLDPLYFDANPVEIATQVETLISRRGWEIVTATPETGDIGDSIQIEATATSGWFGFKDDVAVRIRTEAGITRVDMRSTSRVGLSDLGANAKRIYGLMMELQDKADGRANP